MFYTILTFNLNFLDPVKNCTIEHCYPHEVYKLDNVVDSSLNNCPFQNKTCDNNTKCLSIEMLCNGRNDCLDGSDEGGQCSKFLNIF